MKFIVENWFVIVAIAAVGGSIGYAIEQMRTMLDSNEAVQKLIANEAGEGSE